MSGLWPDPQMAAAGGMDRCPGAAARVKSSDRRLIGGGPFENPGSFGYLGSLVPRFRSSSVTAADTNFGSKWALATL